MLKAPVDSLPEVPRMPLQAPEAVQEVAFVEVQVSVEVPLTATEVGFAVRSTVGIGGGLLLTVTCALRETFPPGPVHCRV